jgi:hypothetical protein
VTSYDSWKLATPPEYEQGDPPDEDEGEDEVVCEECRTTTLAIFSTDGRCQDCDGPVEEAVQAPLLERLKQAHVAAVSRKDVLSARKLEMWVSQVTAVESGLRELEGGRG